MFLALYIYFTLLLLFRSGLGNHYGTLGGPVGAFSPASRPGKEYKSPGKNFSTNPGKKGTGFGYNFLLLVYNMFHVVHYYRSFIINDYQSENFKCRWF